MHDPDTRQSLTGNYVNTLSYHSVTTRQTREHCTRVCLGESPGYQCFDLCYSFKALVGIEYRSVQRLHEAAWNYRNNRAKVFGTGPDVRMSYKKALRNLIVFMFGHYIDAFECHGARKGHRAILSLECLTVADELGRFHHWYKRVDLRKPGVMKTWWKELPHEPQDNCHSSYNSALATIGSPKQPSYRHPKLLGRYFDHVYHQSRHIGQLTWKKWDNLTDYSKAVYNQELGELLSHLQGSGELNHSTRFDPGPTSLLNPEIILPEEEFQAAHQNKEWVSELWACGGEVPSEYHHDRLVARLDWNGNPAELERNEDAIDKKDHEAMYPKADDDYLDDMSDLEESDSVNTLVYDRLGATPASTTIGTDIEVAGDMLNLNMGPPELSAPQEANDSVDSDDDNPLVDMFKVPTEVLAPQDPLPAKPWLDPWALMAEAKFKSDRRTLPPPPGLSRLVDDPDSRNVVLRAIQTPKVTDTPVEVANPQNRDLLYLDWDANRYKALQVMQERCRRESHSSSVGSRSISGK